MFLAQQGMIIAKYHNWGPSGRQSRKGLEQLPVPCHGCVLLCIGKTKLTGQQPALHLEQVSDGFKKKIKAI